MVEWMREQVSNPSRSRRWGVSGTPRERKDAEACYEASAAATISGFTAATFSKARAGPSGRRRPCSQFRSVATLTPIMRANSACDFPSCPRIDFTSTGANAVTRRQLTLPSLTAQIPPPSSFNPPATTYIAFPTGA
jgi:hypothetical protein